MGDTSSGNSAEPIENRNWRWLALVPPAAILVTAAVSYMTLYSPDEAFLRNYREKYGNAQIRGRDVNCDLEYEPVVTYKNPDTGVKEQRILQFSNGQPVLEQYEAKDCKIN